MNSRIRWLTVALVACVAGAAGAANAQLDNKEKWEIGPWSGETSYSRGTFLSCSASYSDEKADIDHAFSLRHYRKNMGDRSASPLYIYFTDDGKDDDDTFGWLDGKTVTFSIGPSLHASGKVVQGLSASFEFEAPSGAIDALAAGGSFVLQLPKGKPYNLKLPPAASAMANFRKCLAANEGR